MIRVTVPRPVAEALMPRECVRSDCLNGHQVVPDQYGGPESVGPCPDCRGRGELPPVLRLLVVEGEPECSLGHECDDTTHDGRCGEPRPDPAIVQAIEAGERIGIDVECDRCNGRGEVEVKPGLMFPCGPCGVPDAEVTADNAFEAGSGWVPVGSVRPVRALPIVGEMPDFDHGAWEVIHAFGPWIVHCYWPNHGSVKAVRNLNAELAVYGPAESLPGKFAVEVEDARREP